MPPSQTSLGRDGICNVVQIEKINIRTFGFWRFQIYVGNKTPVITVYVVQLLFPAAVILY